MLAALSCRILGRRTFASFAFTSFHRPSLSLSRRSLASTSSSSSSSFQQGDVVEIKSSGVFGTIQEVRGSGWYSIQVLESLENSSPPPEPRKVRGSQLTLASINGTVTEGTSMTMNLPSRSNPAVSMITMDDSVYDRDVNTLPCAPAPTIVDLDAALKSLIDAVDPVQRPHDAAYLQHVAHHANFSNHWIVFTDLHCAPSTLDTCLQVLAHVHRLAVERNAGILFLGDWWHHRGTIRVDMLNAVLEALQTWTQPMIMIPGNHDQVTLGGANHGLTPLQNAYRCHSNTTNDNYPGPLVFSHPTIFSKALWVPHFRDNAVLESVLQNPLSQNAKAVFCHADVMGASMNDLILSQTGISPKFFPPHIPIYSGHFHKPHTVTRSQMIIEYAGSPYEVSLSEAHQDKHLLMLDSSLNWDCIERIPVHFGRKHYKIDSVQDLLSIQSTIRMGDRVVVTIPMDALDDDVRRESTTKNEFDTAVATLRQNGAAVEVREIKSAPIPSTGSSDIHSQQMLEDLTPTVTLQSYFKEEVNRQAMSNTTAQTLLQAGLHLLEEINASDEMPTDASLMDLQLTSVSLEGFGPFKDRTVYPLLDRGLVLLRGTNKDGGSDSNGTGKSSLAMAALWALTGSIDPRLVNDSKVADIVSDGSKSAKVTIQGKLNGKEFQILRTKTAKKSNLTFIFDKKDLTTQSAKETQALVEERLGINLQVLARTVFHGQHAINGLLEASDVTFKDEMAFIVPLETWQEASKFARAKARNATKSELELKGMISLREQDLNILATKRDEALEQVQIRRTILEEKQKAAKVTPNLHEDVTSTIDMEEIQGRLNEIAEEIEELQIELKDIKRAQRDDAQKRQRMFDEQSLKTASARKSYEKAQREFDTAVLKAHMAEKAIQGLEKKWTVDLSTGFTPNLVVQNCPTCLQPISMSADGGHIHKNMVKAYEEEVESATFASREATLWMETTKSAIEAATLALESEETATKVLLSNLSKLTDDWDERISNVEKALETARSLQAEKSSELSSAFSSMKMVAEAKVIMAALEAEEAMQKNAEEWYESIQIDFNLATESLAMMNSQADEHKALASTLSLLSDAFGLKGVQNFILQNAIQSLETISQAYLDELSDGSLKLSMNLEAGDKILRRGFVRLPDGDFTERPLSSLSGGQWRRCSLALSLGFVDLISRRGRLRPSLMVLDEPLTHLDRSGRTLVGSLLRKLLVNGERIGGVGTTGIAAGTIILILQDLAAEEIEEAFDHIDEVVKIHGFSSVSVDERSS